MQKTLSPLVKGLITGILMIAATLFLIYNDPQGTSPLQYMVLILYAAGIGWTLYDYSRSENYTGKFGTIFGQGFRCFIIVVLAMVVYKAVYIYIHPEIAEEAAKLYKQDLLKEGNKTPAEIDTIVATAKKQFALGTISMTIFGTLLSGSVFTAAGAGLLLMRKK